MPRFGSCGNRSPWKAGNMLKPPHCRAEARRLVIAFPALAVQEDKKIR